MQGCLGGVQGVSGVQRFWAERKMVRNCMASLLRSIQDFVQEVPVGQMAQGMPPPQFQGVRRGKGEVKPPKSPTRHPKIGGYRKRCIQRSSIYL